MVLLLLCALAAPAVADVVAAAPAPAVGTVLTHLGITLHTDGCGATFTPNALLLPYPQTSETTNDTANPVVITVDLGSLSAGSFAGSSKVDPSGEFAGTITTARRGLHELAITLPNPGPQNPPVVSFDTTAQGAINGIVVETALCGHVSV
jgi:hypothetical protein